MRLVWTALVCGVMASSTAATAPESSATVADPDGGAMAAHPGDARAARGVLTLSECRLEHPLRLVSVAARCGVLEVAENPARPGGAVIGLRVAVIPALNRRATAAPLFLLAGGPGQAATDLYAAYAGTFARINRNHDIVLVDQRGTGGSAPLACTYPDDWQASAIDLPALRDATLACLRHWGDRVRYYTTSVAVGDLEQVRDALGYGAIDLYGSSYGTRVAELYLRRHPESTQAVILDGVTYPEQIIGPDTPFDGERALNLIVARCAAAPECAAAYPLLPRELQDLRRRFGADTVTVTLVDPSNGTPLPLTFNRSLFNAALRFLSYNATQAALLPTLVHRAAQGELAPLASQTVMLTRQVGDSLASGMQNTVICSEDAPGFAAARDARKIADTYQGADQLAALTEICKVWPRGPVDDDLHAELHSDIPSLLLSGDADPVTPPADAERAARGLTHHRHLVLRGEGHGQLATGCVPKLMAQFLDDPRPEALDAACLDEHRPTPFFVGMTGPAP